MNMNNNNVINEFMKMLNAGGNPQAVAMQLFNSNQEAKALLQQMENMAGGMTAKDFAMQYAKQNGIDTQLLMETARKFGL